MRLQTGLDLWRSVLQKEALIALRCGRVKPRLLAAPLSLLLRSFPATVDWTETKFSEIRKQILSEIRKQILSEIRKQILSEIRKQTNRSLVEGGCRKPFSIFFCVYSRCLCGP